MNLYDFRARVVVNNFECFIKKISNESWHNCDAKFLLIFDNFMRYLRHQNSNRFDKTKLWFSINFKKKSIFIIEHVKLYANYNAFFNIFVREKNLFVRRLCHSSKYLVFLIIILCNYVQTRQWKKLSFEFDFFLVFQSNYRCSNRYVWNERDFSIVWICNSKNKILNDDIDSIFKKNIIIIIEQIFTNNLL